VIEVGICETSRTPFFCSSTNSALSVFQSVCVRGVAAARNRASSW